MYNINLLMLTDFFFHLIRIEKKRSHLIFKQIDVMLSNILNFFFVVFECNSAFGQRNEWKLSLIKYHPCLYRNIIHPFNVFNIESEERHLSNINNVSYYGDNWLTMFSELILFSFDNVCACSGPAQNIMCLNIHEKVIETNSAVNVLQPEYSNNVTIT